MGLQWTYRLGSILYPGERSRVGTVNLAEPQAVENRRAAMIATKTPVDMMRWNTPNRFSDASESAAHFMALPVWSSSINTAYTDHGHVRRCIGGIRDKQYQY